MGRIKREPDREREDKSNTSQSLGESLISLPSVPFYLHLLSEDVYLASQSSLNPRQEILKPSEAGWWYNSRFSSQSATEPKSSMNKTVFLPRCYGLDIVWGMSLMVSCVWNLECKNLTCLWQYELGLWETIGIRWTWLVWYPHDAILIPF